ncbi:hypothetical protein, partial [Janthinobacterium sp. LB3P118]|uniref:hypothetical protein n=1 Tax=Janthinobacterium sp. LB3P118 TaxID=3424195 RepID=UPI003F1F7917
TLAQCGELGDEGFPLGWLHGRLPFVYYVPSDSRAPGKFSQFPYLSGTEPKKKRLRQNNNVGAFAMKCG